MTARRLTLPMAVLAAATLAAPASAAVTVGSSLTHAPNASVCAPDPYCTVVHDSLPAAQWAPAGTISPIGVIVAVRVRGGATQGQLALRLLRDGEPAATGSPRPIPPADGAVHTLAERLAVRAGDRLALALGGLPAGGAQIAYADFGSGTADLWSGIAAEPERAAQPAPLGPPTALPGRRRARRRPRRLRRRDPGRLPAARRHPHRPVPGHPARR